MNLKSSIVIAALATLVSGCVLQSRNEPFVKNRVEAHEAKQHSRVSIFNLYESGPIALSKHAYRDSVGFVVCGEIPMPSKNGAKTDIVSNRPNVHVIMSRSEAKALVDQYELLKTENKNVRTKKRETAYIDYTVNDSLVISWQTSKVRTGSSIWMGTEGDRRKFELVSMSKFISQLAKHNP